MEVLKRSRQQCHCECRSSYEPQVNYFFYHLFIDADVNVFLYSRAFRKNKDKSSNEFEDLWISNNFLVTKEKIPLYASRSEIIKRHETVMSPIENALKSITSKNRELYPSTQDSIEILLQYYSTISFCALLTL
jgi:hypothetical protein